MPNFKGGDGEITAYCFVDEKCRIMKAEIEKGSSIGFHKHEDSSEIIYVIKGTASCILEGKEETINAGDCHYCPKGSSHSVKNLHDETLVLLCVVPKQ